jgi:transposase
MQKQSLAVSTSAPATPVVEAVLNLPGPWRIARVDLDETDATLHVWLTHAAHVRWTCPSCEHQCVHHDRGTPRVWRHIDICQYRTFLHADVPRVTCPMHGVADLAMPWAGAGRNYTAAMEDCISTLAHSGGVNEASRVLRIEWQDAWSLMMSRRVGI